MITNLLASLTYWDHDLVYNFDVLWSRTCLQVKFNIPRSLSCILVWHPEIAWSHSCLQIVIPFILPPDLDLWHCLTQVPSRAAARRLTATDTAWWWTRWTAWRATRTEGAWPSSFCSSRTPRSPSSACATTATTPRYAPSPTTALTSASRGRGWSRLRSVQPLERPTLSRNKTMWIYI